MTGEGLDALVAATAQRVHELRAELPEEPTAAYDKIWEAKRRERDKRFSVTNLGGGVFRVQGKAVERMVIQTEWDNDEAQAFLERRLQRAGVHAALVKAGAHTGDEVRVLGRAFVFENPDEDWEVEDGLFEELEYIEDEED